MNEKRSIKSTVFWPTLLSKQANSIGRLIQTSWITNHWCWMEADFLTSFCLFIDRLPWCWHQDSLGAITSLSVLSVLLKVEDHSLCLWLYGVTALLQNKLKANHASSWWFYMTDKYPPEFLSIENTFKAVGKEAVNLNWLVFYYRRRFTSSLRGFLMRIERAFQRGGETSSIIKDKPSPVNCFFTY